MSNVISFSLWGDNPKYNVGAIRNAELSISIYKDWSIRFYIGDNVPSQTISALEQFDHVEIIYEKGDTNWTALLWRFKAIFDCDADVVLFRDTDSRLNLREKSAVDAWLAGDKTVHIMRDHPFHNFPILGGMWGYRKNSKYDFKHMLEAFCAAKAMDAYGTDYVFLGRVLFPALKGDMCVHDPFFENIPFPTDRIDKGFVGEVFDEYDVRHPEHWTYIQ